MGADHSGTLTSKRCWVSLLYDQGKLAVAEPLYRELLAVRLRVLGADHPRTLNCKNNLGTCFA